MFSILLSLPLNRITHQSTTLTTLPGGTEGYPAQPGLICPSVHACRLGIQQKIAQAQQIWSNFLQNHESTWIVNQKFFEIIAWNWRLSQKSGKLAHGSSSPRVIYLVVGYPSTSLFCVFRLLCNYAGMFLQPTRSYCRLPNNWNIRRLEEIYDVFGHKSLPSIGNLFEAPL